jgi:ATP-dependent RNA helicase SUPV3L1/SUV3
MSGYPGRLADLIRPALSWRPDFVAPRPAGAFEGVTAKITSVTSLRVLPAGFCLNLRSLVIA